MADPGSSQMKYSLEAPKNFEKIYIQIDNLGKIMFFNSQIIEILVKPSIIPWRGIIHKLKPYM